MNPDYNFITSQLGVSESAIKSIKTRTTSDSVIYEITLKRMPMNCPLCGGIMIGHGHKTKTINEPFMSFLVFINKCLRINIVINLIPN